MARAICKEFFPSLFSLAIWRYNLVLKISYFPLVWEKRHYARAKVDIFPQISVLPTLS